MTPPRLGPRQTIAALGVLAVLVVVVLLVVRPSAQPGGGDASTAQPVASAGSTAPADAEGPASPTPVAEPSLSFPLQDAALTAQPPAPEPVHLSLPTLGIDLPVDPVGVAADGQMEIPPHAERAGWYRFGPAPGDAQGAAVIAAHVDSIASAGLGPFARLKDLAQGDEVRVELSDGSVVRFAVATTAQVPKTDVTWPDVFDREGPGRLVLVTCGGKWNPKVRHYADNVIVSLTEVGRDGAR